VTVFRLDEGLDMGEILAQAWVAVAPGERAPSLLARLAQEGAALLVDTLRRLESGTVTPRPQDDARASLAPILTRQDGFFRSAWSAGQLEGRVRGFDPWPGVWAACSGRRIRIADAVAIPEGRADAPAGTVLGVDGEAVRLSCSSGSVALLRRLQREGGREVPAREAVQGRWLVAGDRLETPLGAA
jgi:methionyl-tRNA formyltransferase